MTMENKYRLWIIIFSSFATLVTLWLVYSELTSPGYCPPYPLLGTPTCYLVLVFFSLVLGAQFIKDKNISKILFYGGAVPGLGTAIWFSSNQLLGTAQCPAQFSVPLCFVALLTFIALIALKKIGD